MEKKLQTPNESKEKLKTDKIEKTNKISEDNILESIFNDKRSYPQPPTNNINYKLLNENKDAVKNIGDFQIIKKCIKTKARVSILNLQHGHVILPLFMPVGTYGTLKAMRNSKDQIILGNTFHLRDLNKDLKRFSGTGSCLLTDSGGFQMITLENKVTEEAVEFKECKLSPEKSIEIQNTLNSDICMQLDDVVCPMSERVEEACKRSIRWLDRCIKSHKNKNQLLFPIVQGGVDQTLRDYSIKEINERIKSSNLKGVAVGGLSGGEDKTLFARTVYESCNLLPENIPRYTMGVGYPTDVLISVALGSDMSDCVYPTRTARFGRMLADPLFVCDCETCKLPIDYVKIFKGTTNYSIYLTEHNLYYMRKLIDRIKEAILEDRFEQFLIDFYTNFYNNKIPDWVRNSLNLVNIKI